MALAGCVLVSFFVLSAHAIHLEAHGTADLKAMEKIFARSETVRAESMASIMQNMTLTRAWQILENAKSNLTSIAMLQTKSHRLKQSSLRKTSRMHVSNVEDARIMLNSMLYDTAEKYDTEISDCKAAYAENCLSIDYCNSEITSSNTKFAESREMALACASRAEDAGARIPQTRTQLDQHVESCAEQLATMRAHLDVLNNDLTTMDSVLNMTKCKDKEEPPSLMQKDTLQLLQCQDQCTHKSFIRFNKKEVEQKFSQLESPASKELLQAAFGHKFDGNLSLVQLQSHSHSDPAPAFQTMGTPCTDENEGAPAAIDKRALKCTLGTAACKQLTNQFLDIQSDLEDQASSLKRDITKLEKHRDDTKDILEMQIQNDQRIESDAQTCLATATGQINEASENARRVQQWHKELVDEIGEKRSKCEQHYKEFENELCALRKIRGELSLMESSGHSALFQDCVVSDWEEGACSRKCEGGEQTLERQVETPMDGGAKCLPLTLKRTCNNIPCPVDCEVGEWESWSECTAECGSGIQERIRGIERPAEAGGHQCGVLSETRACNLQACDRDCELGSWTSWTKCSKDCGGGTNRRERYVLKPAVGQGHCPDVHSKLRWQSKPCHTHECPALTCKKKLDVVLVMDGSGSLGTTGWEAEKKAAIRFIDAFNVQGGQAKLSVVLYSGPRYRPGANWCVNGHATRAQLESYCKIKSVVSMGDANSTDLNAAKNAVSALTFPEGSTLTSLALQRAKLELSAGREDAESVVVVLTDGRPYKFWRTYWAAQSLQLSARLLWVPIAFPSYKSLADFKALASWPWRENIVKVDDFEILETLKPMNDVVADICPVS